MTKHERQVSVFYVCYPTSQTLAMGARTAGRISREAFEKGLREHLTSLPRSDAAVPGVNGVRSGFSLEMLSEVREALGLGQGALEGLLQVSARTLQRRRERGGQLTLAESDRLWRILHIWHRAAEAFGTEEAARVWLTEPHALLGGEPPLGRLDTEPGLREVEDMLTVIDETAAA